MPDPKSGTKSKNVTKSTETTPLVAPKEPRKVSFEPIGPSPIGEKKTKYKFVPAPGIGSWIWSVCKSIFYCGAVYSLGYFGVSMGWLVGPFIFFVIRDQWEKSKQAQREFSLAAARGDERELVMARLGENNLPSWVIFPDVDRAEWLNHMFKQLWPRINHFVYEVLKKSVEPGLRESLSSKYKLGSFRFEKIVLGDNPIRIRGIKVYDEKKTDRNEIIMDLDIIYAGDCDFRFSVARISAGIKDLHLSGKLRLEFKPLMSQMPLIGGIQYYFLNSPNIDFNLIGAADILDMPGLSELIRRIVSDQIASYCVLPNSLYFQLADNLNPGEFVGIKPQGVIRIHAVEAKNLMNADVGAFGKGKSDPYVILKVGAVEHKSQTIQNNLNPVWNFYCDIIISAMDSQRIEADVYDYDPGFPGVQNDDFLGKASVDCSLVGREGRFDGWIDLEDVKRGSIHLQLTWMGFSSNPNDLKAALSASQPHGLASCLLILKLDSAEHLPNPKGQKPSPYAIVSVGKQEFTSVVRPNTTDPIFEESFSFLIKNPLTDTLQIKIVDKKSKDTVLAIVKQSLAVVYQRPGMKLERQSVAADLKNESKIKISLDMKILKAGHASSSPDDGADVASLRSVEKEEMENWDRSVRLDIEETESMANTTEKKIRLTIRHNEKTNQLTVTIHSVFNLPIIKNELPNAYVKVFVSPPGDSKKSTTDVKKDNTHPTYDERFTFDMKGTRGKKLHVQVFDKKTFKKSPMLGEIVPIHLETLEAGETRTSWYTLN